MSLGSITVHLFMFENV